MLTNHNAKKLLKPKPTDAVLKQKHVRPMAHSQRRRADGKAGGFISFGQRDRNHKELDASEKRKADRAAKKKAREAEGIFDSDSDSGTTTSDEDNALRGKAAYTPVRDGVRDKLPMNDEMGRQVSQPAYFGMQLRRTRMALRVRGHVDVPVIEKVRLPVTEVARPSHRAA